MESTPPPSTSPELDAESENDRFRLLLEQYRSEIQEFSIHEFYQYLATLQQDSAQADKCEDLVFIGKHALDHMVMASAPVNDDAALLDKPAISAAVAFLKPILNWFTPKRLLYLGLLCCLLS
jgi:hypothetical protein